MLELRINTASMNEPEKVTSFLAGSNHKRSKPLMTESTNTKLIPLTQGKFAIVDAEDYDWLMQWKWHQPIQYFGV